MPDIHLFDLPIALHDAAPSQPIRMEDQRFLETLHIFDHDAATNTDTAGVVGKAQYDEVFDEADRDLLKTVMAQIIEEYLEVLCTTPNAYCHAAVKTSKGWRFVYGLIQDAAPKVRN